MAAKAADDRKGANLPTESFETAEKFFGSLKAKGTEWEKEERRKARKAKKAAAKQPAKPLNNKERRKARKAEREKAELEHGKAVAQASEDLRQSALLSRKRKRSAARILKLEALEEEKLERKKLVTKAKKDLKCAGNLPRNQIRAAEKINRASSRRKEDHAHQSPGRKGSS